MPEPTRLTLELDGRGTASLLHWNDAPADAPTLVFAHANGFCADLWREVANPLGQTYRMIAYDARGHGQSAQPTRADDLTQFLRWDQLHDDLAALLGTLTRQGLLKPPVIGVGHSMGGMVMTCTAAKHPHLFDSIFALDPVVWWPESGTHPVAAKHIGRMVEGARKRRSEFSDRATAAAGWRPRETFKDWDARVFEAYVEHGLRDTEQGVVLRCAPDTEATLFSAQWNEDMRVLARQVTCPGKVVHASRGHFRESMHLELADLAPGLEFERFDGTHFFPMEQPAQTAAWLRMAISARMLG